MKEYISRGERHQKRVVDARGAEIASDEVAAAGAASDEVAVAKA